MASTSSGRTRQMNRYELRRLRDQIGMHAARGLGAIPPPPETVTPSLERHVARPRLTPIVRRVLLALVFLTGAALGAMIPAGCGASSHSKPDAACACVLVDAGEQIGDPGSCIDPVTGRPGLCR